MGRISDYTPYYVVIREELAEVPNDWLTDAMIDRALQKADDFCDEVLAKNLDMDVYAECVVALGTYYAYIQYTSMAENQLGSMPVFSVEKARILRQYALMKLRKYAVVALSDDLQPLMAPYVSFVPMLERSYTRLRSYWDQQ